jgi:hypothetical protein
LFPLEANSRDSRLPSLLSWLLPSSRLLRGVRKFVVDVSGIPIASIFNGQAIQAEGPFFLDSLTLENGTDSSPETSFSNHFTPRSILEDRRPSPSTVLPLRMRPIGSPETSVSNRLTPRDNPEDGRFQLTVVWIILKFYILWKSYGQTSACVNTPLQLIILIYIQGGSNMTGTDCV